MIGKQEETDYGRYELGAVTAWVVLALILLFAGLSVALIALGGQAYRSILYAADENAQRRASVGYVVGRVRAFDREEAVRVERMTLDNAELDVLILTEDIDGEAYETRIYCADGRLREQFVSADTALESVQDGETIAMLTGFEVKQEPGMLEMGFVYPDGQRDVVHAVLHSGQEGTI